MSGCLSQSPYIMSNNIVTEEHHHSLNPLEKKGTTPNISSSFINIINNNSNNNSIRRTLSADMSSQKWIENNGFSLKRVQSSEELKVLGEEDDQNNVELNDNKGSSGGGAAFEDIWSSILSQKKPDEAGSGTKDPAPYVHPLMKRASSLSEKSLEICTESLGSETGSDGFSYPPSDPGEEEEEEEEEEQVKNDAHVEEMKGYVEVAKYSYNYQASNKKVSIGAPRSFPPPLPSLANRDDGSNLHMRTRRQDGRLVLEAVSVPSQNCFRARRQDGRLVLMLTNDDEEQELDDEEVDDDEVVVLDEKMSDDREVEDEIDQVKAVSEDIVGNVEKKLALVAVEEASRLPSARMVNVHRQSSAMIMNKLMGNRNKSTWPRSSNMTVIKSLDDEEDGKQDIPAKKKSVEMKAFARQKGTKCLPPRPRVSRATAAADVMNAYEYYWRRSDSPAAAAVAVLKPLAGKQGNTASPQVVKDTTKNKYLLARNGKGGQQEAVVIVKAAGVGGAAGEKGEYLVPMLRGCKEPRRPPLLFWEPYCIATS